MNKPARNIEWLVWGGLVLIIGTIAGAFVWSRLGSAKPLLVIGQISDFNLTNQDNQPVSLADLRGKVWVADIIFTRCPGPCPTMSHNLAELQAQLPAALPPDSPVKLVTLTSDPEFDTPPVLKKYAERFNADSNRWIFLTGPRLDIRKLAVNDFKFVVVDKSPPTARFRMTCSFTAFSSCWLTSKAGCADGPTTTAASMRITIPRMRRCARKSSRPSSNCCGRNK